MTPPRKQSLVDLYIDGERPCAEVPPLFLIKLRRLYLQRQSLDLSSFKIAYFVCPNPPWNWRFFLPRCFVYLQVVLPIEFVHDNGCGRDNLKVIHNGSNLTISKGSLFIKLVPSSRVKIHQYSY